VINLEWKWVKSLLIILFLILDCFLGYQVYQRNTISVVNAETMASLNTILETNNIKCDFEWSGIETKKYMRKIKISNDKNIEEKFLPTMALVEKEINCTGRNRKIIPLPSIIINFLRDSKLKDITIKSITLGYYPEINQIDKTVLSGEATPAWRIVLDDEREYVYNAYLGDLINN